MQVQQTSVGALIQDNKGAFLVVKRADNDDFYPGFWELPGGGVDYGELPQESLKREIQEECGLAVEVLYPLVVNTYTMPVEKDEVQRIEITFLCKSENEDQEVVLSNEHSEYRWITKEEIKDFDFSDYMREVIEDALKNPLVV